MEEKFISQKMMTPKEPMLKRILRSLGFTVEDLIVEIKTINAVIRNKDSKFENKDLEKENLFAFIEDMYGFKKYELPAFVRPGEEYIIALKTNLEGEENGTTK